MILKGYPCKLSCEEVCSLGSFGFCFLFSSTVRLRVQGRRTRTQADRLSKKISFHSLSKVTASALPFCIGTLEAANIGVVQKAGAARSISISPESESGLQRSASIYKVCATLSKLDYSGSEGLAAPVGSSPSKCKMIHSSLITWYFFRDVVDFRTPKHESS